MIQHLSPLICLRKKKLYLPRSIDIPLFFIYTIYKDQNYHSYFYDENTVHGKRVTGFIQEDPWEVVSISGNKMKLKLQSSTYEVVFGEEYDGTYYVISLKKISGM